MTRLVGAELFELDLPFRRPFRHAAASRAGSRSVFLRCLTDTGHCGYGETLPRPYVTGEERGSTFDLLVERILPRLLGTDFASFAELHWHTHKKAVNSVLPLQVDAAWQHPPLVQ